MLPWGTSPRTGSPWTASWLLIAVLGIALVSHGTPMTCCPRIADHVAASSTGGHVYE